MKYRLNRSFIPWIFFHTFEYWYYYIGAGVCLYFLHYYSSEIPLMAKELGDLAIAGKLGELKISEFFILAGFIIFYRTLSRLLFFYPARVQQKNLRLELVNRLESAFPRAYGKYNEGMIFQSLYNDLNRIRGFMGFALLQVGNIIIASTIFVPKIQEFNGDFLIAFSPIICCVILFMGIIYFFQPFVKRGMDESAAVQNFLLESYEAKKTIQNYHAERSFCEKFTETSDIELRTFFISTFGRAISFPMVRIGVGVSLIWAALIVKEQNLPASDLIFFSSFLFLILEPLMVMSWIGIVTSQGYAGWTRIKELVGDLDQKFTEPFLIQNDIENPVLPLWEKEAPLEFPQNRWTVLIGETGSGKSWLLERYSELLFTQKKKFSFIHQEPYLYNDTLVDNIFLGTEKTPERLERAKFYLKEFGLDVLSKDMNDLLEMELGENGKRVSGGQAKRIALIRSLVADVDIIVWDDPFSSVDLILESQILKKIKTDPALKGKTFILSSHRLSTVKACHEIIYIGKEKGVIEKGRNEDLLNKGSKVDEFFEKQNI